MASRPLSEQEREAIRKSTHVDLNIRRTLSLYPGLTAEQIEEYARQYDKDNGIAAPTSATTKNATKQAPEARKDMTVKDDRPFNLNTLPTGWSMKKGADGKTRVYMPTPEGFVEVDRKAVEILMDRVAGMGTSEETMYPMPGAARFPGSASIVDRPANENAPAPPEPYDIETYPGIPSVRLGYGFALAPIDPGINPPEPFDPSEPEEREQGPEPVDFIDDRAAIFKRAHGTGKVAPGTFKNTMPDQNGRPFGG